MDFDKVSAVILCQLDHQLAENISYHNADHTRRVLDVVLKLACEEKISDRETILIATAALFANTGFMFEYDSHEQKSCELAAEYLPSYGYSEEQIAEVCRLIKFAKSSQNPKDTLEGILLDAEMSYLGTDAFESLSGKLYKELNAFRNYSAIEMWPLKQIQRIKGYQYYTHAARSIFDVKKEENLKELEKNFKPPINQARPSVELIIKDLLLILFGVIMVGFALKGFLVPNHFFDGGITGISLLLHEQYHFNLGYIIVLANLPLIIVSYYTVNYKFAMKTFISVLLLGICLLYLRYPLVTSDKLLISVFGGFFLGIGVGLTMRAGCALDGIEILALFTLKRTSFTITEIILGINVLIFLIAAFKFGMESALYSILTYFTASKTIDYVVEGIEAYTGVTIISGQSDILKEKLVNKLGRGITVYKGERGFLPGNFYQSSECDIIFTVVTRLEMRKLKNLVAETDPQAFVFASNIKEATGGILRRKARH